MGIFTTSNPSFCYAVNESAIIRDGLVLDMDASDRNSYDTYYGRTWKDISGYGTQLTASLTSSLGGGSIPPYTKTSDGGYLDVRVTSRSYAKLEYDTKIDPTNEITLETMVYGTGVNLSTYQEIYRKESGNRHLFSFQSAGTIISFGLTTSVSGYVELDRAITAANFNNRWNHILVTYKSGAKAIYVNGVVLVGILTTQTGTIPQANVIAEIGAFNGGNEWLNARLAFFRMYNRYFEAADVQKNFNAVKQRYNINY